MAEETVEKKHDPYSSMRIREFRYFVYARLFLTIAIQIQTVIVGWQVYEITKQPLSLGLIGLSEAIPHIAMSLFAGYVADIVSRRKILLLSVIGFFAGALALLSFTIDSSFLITYGTLPIYTVVALTGLARAFSGPASSSLWPQIVPREIYANASAWNTTIWQVGAVSGPAIGGLIYGYLGVTKAYLIDASLILIALFYIFLINSRPVPERQKKESLKNSLKAGIRFVFSNQIILGALSLDLFAVLFGGAVAMLPVFAHDVLRAGPEGLGLLRAAPSVGAVVMALILAHQPPMKKAGRNLLIAVAGFGVCMILFALSKNFYLSLAILALSGALDNISVVTRSTILQLLTPDDMRGRVSAVNNIFVGSSNEIGEFESGITAHWMGLIPSVIFGGCMTLLVVLFTSRLSKKLTALNLRSLT